ncbi:MAG: hypothetical protein FWC57_01335 [Endomicrobia bacterium]|nr:hypothetical protein [Endomicrobiia bacterium]
MKRIILAFFVVLSFSSAAFCARQFIEGTDYSVDFQENDDGAAAAVRIVFTNIIPTPGEAEQLVKERLKIYAKIIDKETAARKKAEAKNAPKTKAAAPAKKDAAASKINGVSVDTQTYKNIIGSAWYAAPAQQNPAAAVSTQTAVASNALYTPLVSLSSGAAAGNDFVKVKFQDDVSAYVYLGKTKKIVSFPAYIAFLKKERDLKKAVDKAAAQAARQTSEPSQQPAGQPMAEQSAAGQPMAEQPAADEDAKQ